MNSCNIIFPNLKNYRVSLIYNLYKEFCLWKKSLNFMDRILEDKGIGTVKKVDPGLY